MTTTALHDRSRWHEAIRRAQIPARQPLAMLFLRLLSFVFWQAVIAAVYALGGSKDAWAASAAWWPISAALSNVVNLGLLRRFFNAEGGTLREIYRFHRPTFWRDLLVSLGLLVVLGPVSMLPSNVLGVVLFGNIEQPNMLLIQALPAWAAIAAVILFPISTALAELPNYFIYVAPRLSGGKPGAWWGTLAVVLLLSLQHLTLPLIYNWRFIIWRAWVFLPFALLVGVVLRWRPRMLPFLVIGHFLIDFMTVFFIVQISL